MTSPTDGYKFLQVIQTQAGQGIVIGRTQDGNGLAVTLQKRSVAGVPLPGPTRIFTWCERHADWVMEGHCNACVHEGILEEDTDHASKVGT